MDALRKDFLVVGFKGPFSLGLLDPHHILTRFDLEEDYHRCWLQKFWSFQRLGMRVFKMPSIFSEEFESSVVPTWIHLPNLPIHLFGKGPLSSIAKLIGEPLKLDASTVMLSRPSVARICIGADLLQDLPSHV